MGYWRLTIQRPMLEDQIIDLREKRSVYAGDAFSNDVCINTAIIPGKLKLVSQWFGKVRIQLTEETLPSLKGQFHKKSNWKTSLFKGETLEVDGITEWTIGDAHFKLEKVELIALSALPKNTNQLERKHWAQSFGGAVAVHLILFALLLLFKTFSPAREIIAVEDIQKIAIADVNKIFEEPKIEPLPEPKLDVIEEPQGATTAMTLNEKAPQEKSTKPLVKAIAKKGDLPRPSVSKMGLLAIQKTAQPKKTNIDIAALANGVSATSKSKDKLDPRAELGLASAMDDLSIRVPQPGTEVVAMVEGKGIESYQGGLAESVNAGSKRSASIRLVKREVEVRGGLDPAVIRQIIEERLSEVQYCYETALLKQAGLEGKISASWTIMPDGSVSGLKSESDEINNAILHPCIAEQIKAWKFPSPKGGGVVHVKYPFLFSPMGS